MSQRLKKFEDRADRRNPHIGLLWLIYSQFYTIVIYISKVVLTEALFKGHN